MADANCESEPIVNRRRQLHLWVSERDYDFLERFALSRDESMSSVIRHIIKRLRTAQSDDKAESQIQISGTSRVPIR